MFVRVFERFEALLVKPGFVTLVSKKESEKDEMERWRRRATVSTKELILFSRSLATLFNAGVQLAPALESISEQTEDARFRNVILHLSNLVCTGHSLSRSFAEFPRIFPPAYVATVRLAEKTGDLHGALKTLADWQERDRDMTMKVRSAATYPIFVSVLASLLTLGLFFYIMPGFVEILTKSNVPLPWLTQLVIALTDLVRTAGFWLVMGGIGLELWSRYRRFRDDPASRRPILRFLSCVPVAGTTLSFYFFARLCGSVGSLLKAGGRLTDSLTLAGEATANPLLLDDLKVAAREITTGRTWGEYLSERTDFYPAAMSQMVTIGEETGRLVAMLKYLEEIYHFEFENRMERLNTLVEPLLLGFVGFCLGLVMFAVLSPMYAVVARVGN